MENVSLSSANQVYLSNQQNNVSNPIETNKNIEQIEDGDKKSLNALKWAGIIAAGALAAGGTAVALRQGKVKNAQEFFDSFLKTQSGNNKILNETIENSNTQIQKLISDNQDDYQKFLESIKKTISPKEISEVASDGYLYHGTSVGAAKNILSEGITPFVVNEGGNKLPGLGRAVYTTPDVSLAKGYSTSGVVLPYKFDGKIGEVADAENFRVPFLEYLQNLIEPNPKSSGIGPLRFASYNQKTVDLSQEYLPEFMNKSLRDLGYDGIYTKYGTTKGLFQLGQLPENIDSAGQLAILDGQKLALDADKLKELNPINGSNYSKFLDEKLA